METTRITSFASFLKFIDAIPELGKGISLFRGQPNDDTLLPTAVRDHPTTDTTEAEKEMLSEFKRRSGMLITTEFKTDWEWLIYAQHFGLKTRLLDWSSNPLTALWFACREISYYEQDSYVYYLKAEKEQKVDLEKHKDPFSTAKTKVLQPRLNNARIVAQSGWFTAHKFSTKANRFIPLEENRDTVNNLHKLIIPARQKMKILVKLAVFGVNNRTVFPDVAGLCWHLNWVHRDSI